MESKNNVSTKDSGIHFRVNSKEKENIQSTAVARGFDTISAYLLYLYRKDSKDFFDGRR